MNYHLYVGHAMLHCSKLRLLNPNHDFTEVRPSGQILESVNGLIPLEHFANDWLDFVLRNECVKSLEHFETPDNLSVKLYTCELSSVIVCRTDLR